jgi:hypothetical protein
MPRRLSGISQLDTSKCLSMQLTRDKGRHKAAPRDILPVFQMKLPVFDATAEDGMNEKNEHYPVGIVTIGAAPFSPVSTRVKSQMRKEKNEPRLLATAAPWKAISGYPRSA